MSEELLQSQSFPIGRYRYHRIGATTLSQLKKAGIVSGSIPTGIKNKKPDGIITLGKGVVKACIEYKPTRGLSGKTQRKIAIDQEREVARKLCNLLIVTDSQTTLWINPHTGNHVETPLMHTSLPVFDAKAIMDRSMSLECLSLIESTIDQSDHSLSLLNDALTTPKVIDPSHLAKTIWKKIWINTGQEPEKCLYNVVELFVFKFLSDLSVLGSHNDFAAIHGISQKEGPEAALTSYAQISRKAILALFPVGGDGTTIINGTIFVNGDGDPDLRFSPLFGEVMDGF